MSILVLQANSDRVPLEEMAAAEEKGAFSYQPQKPDADEDDDFVEAPQSQQTSKVRHDCLFSRQMSWL